VPAQLKFTTRSPELNQVGPAMDGNMFRERRTMMRHFGLPMETTKEFFAHFLTSTWLVGGLLAAVLLLWKRLADLRRRKREESLEAELALRIVDEQIEAAERKEREDQQRMLSNEIHRGGFDLGHGAH
jgi:flagellar biosynthesis/type III secretory pathway M-ring protein FliF/YscJ